MFLGENVYIYYHLGISLSLTVVIAYLMKKYGLSAMNAIETVNLLKVNSYPNNGFIDQLLWENMTYELNGNNCDYRKLVFRNLRDRILLNI